MNEPIPWEPAQAKAVSDFHRTYGGQRTPDTGRPSPEFDDSGDLVGFSLRLPAAAQSAASAAPVSDERLEEIRRSIPTVYGPPWTARPNWNDDTWTVRYATENPLAGLVATVPDYGENLADFIATARTAVPELLAEVERLRARVDEVERKYIFDTADLKRERDALKDRLHQAALTKVWTNEDGKKFVFVEDIAPPLLGTTPTGGGVS